MTATVLNPIKQKLTTWQLKDRQVKVVGSHSGQYDCWYLRILWSDKLGLTYYKSFDGNFDDPKIKTEAKKVAEYIMQKGFIHPDAITKYSDDNPVEVPVWRKDFYPHRDYLQTRAD
tara:strand:- start:36 stop:383 length:348 start_codon:yes stop_codon:yes gene_type:complete